MQEENLTSHRGRVWDPGLLFVLAVSLVAGGSPAPPAWAVERGSTAADFLLISGDARPVSLGGTFSALGRGDAGGIDYNVALISGVDRKEISLTRLQYFEGASGNHIAYIAPGPAHGAWGFSINHFTPGSFERTNEIGVFTGERLSAFDVAFLAAYSRHLGQSLSYGVGGKIIHRELAGVPASAGAVDLGLYYEAPVPGLSFGASAQNLGSKIRFISAREDLPRTFRLGTAYRVTPLGLTLAADVVRILDEKTKVSVGAEFRFADRFFVRGGYRTGEDAAWGGSLGFGYRGDNLGIDYAYVPYDFLGQTHRFTARFAFGRPLETPRPGRPIPSPIPSRTPRAEGVGDEPVAPPRGAPSPPAPYRVEGVVPKENPGPAKSR